jgi:hypothetical protein
MDYMGMAAMYARQYGLDPEIFLRQIAQESKFNPDAVSPKGAVGIARGSQVRREQGCGSDQGGNANPGKVCCKLVRRGSNKTG